MPHHRPPTVIRVAIGAVLRGYREHAGLSQEDFAVLADVHRTYVGSAERGERNISSEALDRWLNGLGATWGQFGLDVEKELEARRIAESQ